jgi:hypothetical protein
MVTPQVEQSCGWCPDASYPAAMTAITETVPPTEFVGAAGDVLFLHPLMVRPVARRRAVEHSVTTTVW